MRILRSHKTLAMLVVAFPLAALADISGTPTLTSGMTLNLDTGATAASGGDIIWSGTNMTPQTNATAYNIGNLGSAGFSAMTQSTLSSFSAAYTNTAIAASTLVVGDVFAVHTNGGHYAAVLVTAVSGSSISLQFTTFGVSSAPSGPTITEIENNYGEIPPGFSNSGIAQGALFFIVGTGMADPNAVAVLQDSTASGGLPTTLNGASVKVTVNGTTVVPVFYYSEAIALGMVLPSNTPIGTGQVTVTYNGQTSAPYTIQVVQNAMGFDAYYGTGAGLGVATNPLTGQLYDYAHSIPPGTTVVMWGSGLGADPKPQRDAKYTPVTSIAADTINGLAGIYVGGVPATIGYQGASGFPGLNQINVTIPNNAPTGCNVSVVGVSPNGSPTNFLSLPIGSGACTDSSFGISGAQLSSLSGQATVSSGSVGLIQSTSQTSTGAFRTVTKARVYGGVPAVVAAATGTTVDNTAFASFQKSSGSVYGSASGQVSIGGCIVNQFVNSTGGTGTSTGLDAGTITLSGPSGSPVTLSTIPGVAGSSYALLDAGYIPTSGGTFTFKGAGGANVGPFTASVIFPNPALSWTNQSAAATITRSSGLQVTWSGGASGTYVVIGGGSASTSPLASGSFTCIAPVSAGQFAVPSYVLMAMPAGSGSVSVENTANYQTFSASGLDFGTAYGAVTFDVNSTFK